MKKLLFLLSVFLFIAALVYFDVIPKLTLEEIKSYQNQFHQYQNKNLVLVSGLFSLIYIFSTSFNIPIATTLSLLSGACFGFFQGLLIALTSATIGATLSFLLSRYFFRKALIERFPTQYKKIDDGFEKNGIQYLLTLRLMPMFPFFVINLLMGLTQIDIKKYFIVSYFGMLPGAAVLVNAGTQLSKLQKIEDVFTPQIFLSFFLLGLLPLLQILVKKMPFATKDNK